MRTISRFLLAAAVFAFAAACGDDGGGNPNEPTPVIAKTAANSGDGQTAGVTEELPEALRVIVTLDGVPVEGVDVTWAASANGGSVVPATATTGPDGIATGTWTFGTKSGGLTATAALAGATGSPVSFTGTANADVASGFVIQGGDDQTGLVNTPFPDPLTVLMHDQYNNPVAGQNVGWSVTSGDADLFGTESATSAAGIATMTATFGTVAGPIEIEAAPQNGLPPQTFSAISAPAPSAIVIEVDNNFFLPQQDTVAAGGTVTWKWIGSGHTVTSDPAPGLLDSGIRNAGYEYPVVFDTPGTYNYRCTQHPPGMVGTIVVL